MCHSKILGSSIQKSARRAKQILLKSKANTPLPVQSCIVVSITIMEIYVLPTIHRKSIIPKYGGLVQQWHSIRFCF